MSRKLDALVPYYGCKRQIADRIVQALGDHRAYWEPFCGSCAVFLAKSPCRMEVLNDLHGDVVNLARVVADEDQAVKLFERLSRTAFCEALYKDSLAWLAQHGPEASKPVERAYHYFVASWQGRNGLVGTEAEATTGFCKRHTSNGGDPSTRFRNAVDRLPAWWSRFRNATILSEDGVALCSRIEDKQDTAIYADPPYLDKKAKYLHDFASDQHGALARALGRFKKTKVVVSYYDHPALGELYPEERWEKIFVATPKNLSVQAGKETAPEVLLVSRR